MGSFFESVQKEIELSSKHLDKVFGLSKNEELTVKFLKEKLDKERLANLVLESMKRTQNCMALLRKASSEVESNQKEAKAAGNEVIKLQGELLECKTEQINQFQSLVDTKLKDTIKTEMRSYSEVVKKNVGESLTIRNIKTAVKDIVKSSSTEREKNLIVFGVPEESGENLTDKVSNIFETIQVKPRFVAERFGKATEKRPIRVTVDKLETTFEVLKSAKNLKHSRFNNIFISLDKSPEERAERKRLVEEMKKKIAENPEKKYYIRRGELCCEEKPVRDSAPSEKDEEEEQSVSPVRLPWRPPPFQKPGPGTARRPKRPIFSETSIDSSDNE